MSETIGSLSRDVFERPTSTGSELFSLLVCLDANKFVLLSLFSPLKTIYSRVSTKPLPNDAKSSLPVDVRRSKTLLLKLPIKEQLQLPLFFLESRYFPRRNFRTCRKTKQTGFLSDLTLGVLFPDLHFRQ